MIASPSTNNLWLKCPRPKPGARLRLLCFPYAGGGSLIYRNWPERLPPSVEVLLAQLPGREARLGETPYSRLPEMVEALAEAMLPYLDKPFVFFGHSMGAMISFELARRLRQTCGREPEHIFVSGRRAPQLPDDEEATYNLPDDQFLDHLARLKGTPQQVLEDAEVMQLMLPLLRADFAVCQTYVYTPLDPPLSSSITALGGLQDYETGRKQLEGWREQTTGAFALRMLNGDHFFINTMQADVLRIVEQELHMLLSRVRHSPVITYLGGIDGHPAPVRKS